MVQTLNPLASLPGLLVKDGVRLGGLGPEQQSLVLAWVWAGLVERGGSGGWSEPALNDALRAELAEGAAFLDIDHVELRRWLVDAAWLTRDTWGRSYRRVPLHQLAPQRAALAQALLHLLGGRSSAAHAAALRQAHAAQRAARRQAWQAARATAAGEGRGAA